MIFSGGTKQQGDGLFRQLVDDGPLVMTVTVCELEAMAHRNR